MSKFLSCAMLTILGVGCSAREQKPVGVEHGLVVSDSLIASRVGRDVLQKGGNAVEAAVATGFALAVSHPAAGNIGGGGFMVVRMADGRAVAIDYREVAPKAATATMYQDFAGNLIADSSLVGYKAVGVPGTVAGMYEAQHRFGKMNWSEVVEPARKLAADGFKLPPGLANAMELMAKRFKAFPETARIFNRTDKPYKSGETFVQSDLAQTLQLIEDNGPKGFYEGEIAKKVADDMRRHGGLITEGDLGNYRPKVRELLRGRYHGLEILTMPPPSSGGVALIEMLNILSVFNLSQYQADSWQARQLLVESMKRAFADRAAHMGDPDFVQMPVDRLISMAYADRLRATISLEHATPSTEIRSEGATEQEGHNTTHFSVVDKDGNAVSNTYTLNTGFGSLVVAKGTGFILNNEMDDFASKPGSPNGFGLIQGEANAIAPGKRPLSSMTPTIVLKDGKLFMVAGSPGGPTIINTVMETILNVADFGMSIQEAVDAPRFHHQWMPDRIDFEEGAFSAEALAKLQNLGQKFSGKPETIGSCQCILIDPKTGERLVGVDHRASTYGASGY